MAVAQTEVVAQNYRDWEAEVRALARERGAVILAHAYQAPWIQQVADYVGDSLELSRQAAATSAGTIVFCGVHFMAETAKVLSPDRTVLIPDMEAGCSLADSINAAQLQAWKEEHPGAIVVAYVNTSAEVKALSDYCCTSANAVAVVQAVGADRDILFLPDMFLAAHVERVTGRKLHTWMGECHVHAGIEPADLDARLAEYPDAELYIHPECGCASHALYLASTGALPAERTHVLSTAGMARRAVTTGAAQVIVATETGLIHRLQTLAPGREFIAANEAAVCRYMKMITPDKLLESLRCNVHEVVVDPVVAGRARLAIERMIAIG